MCEGGWEEVYVCGGRGGQHVSVCSKKSLYLKTKKYQKGGGGSVWGEEGSVWGKEGVCV